jgi:septal ring factor EnvC (AmiA/AmiB activator)
MRTNLRSLRGAVARHRRGLLVAALVLAVIGGLTADQLARRELRQTRSTLADTGTERDAARLELAEQRGRLTGARTEAARRTASRDEFRRQLETARQQLEAVQGQISSTTELVYLTGPQLEVLGRCLNSVSAALNQAAVDDPGAGNTLAVGQAACTEAAAILTNAPPA